jgi:DNA-binding CsgD family transcriptional regulator
VHRVLGQLEKLKLIIRDRSRERYSVGPRVAKLSFATLRSLNQAAPIRSILQDLVDEPKAAIVVVRRAYIAQFRDTLQAGEIQRDVGLPQLDADSIALLTESLSNPDEIEALISLGRLDEAKSLLARLTEQGRTMHRPWALAAAARCRGLLMAAEGDTAGAPAALEQALLEHGDEQQPFELGRTLMVKGQVERRAKQKRVARSSLDQALRIFESLGAPLWAERARSELSRVGGPAARGELTATERRVAGLVVEGLTNREVADALFVSLKTVEANLSRIYHKMGIESRRELQRAMRPADTVPGSA